VRVRVREAEDKADIRRFVHFPWSIYRGDRNWVPPLKSEMWSIVTGKDNPLFKCGPHALFLAEDGDKVVGRVLTAIDNELNAARGRGWGYFSLFESTNSAEVASALLATCEEWLRERGCRVSRGPVSPDNGDDNRGLLIDGFDTPPALMDSYNRPYYAGLIEGCGYEGDRDDRLAYFYEVGESFPEKALATLDYAKARWKFRIDRANLKDLENEFMSLKAVVDAAMPEWPDMIPPTMDELRLMARKILPVADPDFIYLARSEAGEPIGFLMGLPDYNQALKHLNGSLFPLGWAKFLWYRRRINGLRIFVLFVVPTWQKKAVSHAMFLEAFLACKKKGYTWAEGSTVVESNGPMNRDAVGAGGRLYKRYRTYEKPL